MEKLIGLLNGIVLLLKNHGIDGVYWLIVIAYIAGAIYPELSNDIISASNIIVLGIIWIGTKLIKAEDEKIEHHVKGNQIRMNVNTNVKTELLKLKYESQADRAYILEGHNGRENNTHMAFYYLDMTYEETSLGKYVNAEYENLNTSIYDFPQYLSENFLFVGEINELSKIDRKIYHKMKDNGVKYCGMILLKNNGVIIGVLGVSYTEKPTLTKEEIQSKLSIYAQDISDFLDLRSYKKKKKKFL